VNTKLQAHLGLLSTNLFFAINLSAVKYLTANHFMEPFGMNLIRVGISAVLFWAIYLVKPFAKKFSEKIFHVFYAVPLKALPLTKCF